MEKIKNFSKVFVVFFIVAVIYTSCKKDDPDPDPDPLLPTASFIFSPNAIVQYDLITFTNASTDALSYSWDFGDGNTSTDENPDYMYIETGTYTVSLTAVNDDGEDTYSEDITVSTPNNYCTISGDISFVDENGVDQLDSIHYDGSEIPIDTAFWYPPPMGGNSYIRFLGSDSQFPNPLLIKFFPNLGLGNLDQVYTYALAAGNAGEYDLGMTGDYAGMDFAWTVDSYEMTVAGPVAKPYVDATVTLVYEPDGGENIYDIVIENILVNGGDLAPGFVYFLESTNPVTVSFYYRGPVTPL